jgi:hypothetical protein
MVGNRIAVLSGDRNKAGRSLALVQRQWLIASLCHGDTAKTAIEGENSGQTTWSDRDACQAHRSVAAGTKGGVVLFHGAIVTGALLPQCYLDHAGCSGAADGLAGTGAVAIWRRMMSGELLTGSSPMTVSAMELCRRWRHQGSDNGLFPDTSYPASGSQEIAP